jgi:hypothetical protein
VAFAKEQALPNWDIVHWLALAERLQLDDLRERCLTSIRAMTRGQLQMTIFVEVEAGSGADKRAKHAISKEVGELGQALREELLTITSFAS